MRIADGPDEVHRETSKAINTIWLQGSDTLDQVHKSSQIKLTSKLIFFIIIIIIIIISCENGSSSISFVIEVCIYRPHANKYRTLSR